MVIIIRISCGPTNTSIAGLQNYHFFTAFTACLMANNKTVLTVKGWVRGEHRQAKVRSREAAATAPTLPEFRHSWTFLQPPHFCSLSLLCIYFKNMIKVGTRRRNPKQIVYAIHLPSGFIQL